MATLAPFLASSMAIALPIPVAPPVTRATLLRSIAIKLPQIISTSTGFCL
jgi:hypothetical protein